MLGLQRALAFPRCVAASSHHVLMFQVSQKPRTPCPCQHNIGCAQDPSLHRHANLAALGQGRRQSTSCPPAWFLGYVTRIASPVLSCTALERVLTFWSGRTVPGRAVVPFAGLVCVILLLPYPEGKRIPAWGNVCIPCTAALQIKICPCV